MKILSAAKKIIKGICFDPRANSSLIDKVEIIRGGVFYITFECRKGQDGSFMIITISGGDTVGTVLLDRKECRTLVEGISRIMRENSDEFL